MVDRPYPKVVSVVRNDRSSISHGDRDLGGLVARSGTQVEDPVTRLGVEQENRQQGDLFLYMVESAEKPPVFARLGVADQELECPWTPWQGLQRYPLRRQQAGEPFRAGLEYVRPERGRERSPQGLLKGIPIVDDATILCKKCGCIYYNVEKCFE